MEEDSNPMAGPLSGIPDQVASGSGSGSGRRSRQASACREQPEAMQVDDDQDAPAPPPPISSKVSRPDRLSDSKKGTHD
jgi:hypothetical protein